MSDILLENRMTTLEEMMVRLTRNAERSDRRIDRLTENAERRDRRIDRLTENAERRDRRIDRLSDMVYHSRQDLDRLSEKVERTTQNLERLSEELRASHEEMRAEHYHFRQEQKAQQKQWNKKWGELSNKWGTMVEDLVAPSLPRLLRKVAPCSPDEPPVVNIRVRRRHPSQKGKMFEMDGVVDCGEYALFCECKSTLKPADITQLVTKLAQARDYFPEYADHHLLGAVAALYIDRSLVQYASHKGILAFAVGTELMVVQNEAGFTPQRF